MNDIKGAEQTIRVNVKKKKKRYVGRVYSITYMVIKKMKLSTIVSIYIYIYCKSDKPKGKF